MKKTKILAFVFFIAACCYAIGTVNHIVNTGESVMSSMLLTVGFLCIAVGCYRMK